MRIARENKRKDMEECVLELPNDSSRKCAIGSYLFKMPTIYSNWQLSMSAFHFHKHIYVHCEHNVPSSMLYIFFICVYISVQLQVLAGESRLCGQAQVRTK
jgi:hypothetical protein